MGSWPLLPTLFQSTRKAIGIQKLAATSRNSIPLTMGNSSSFLSDMTTCQLLLAIAKPFERRSNMEKSPPGICEVIRDELGGIVAQLWMRYSFSPQRKHFCRV